MEFGVRHRTLAPWIVGLIIVAALNLLIAVAVMVDSRIVAWSHVLAQNAAEAAVMAGTNSLQELLNHPRFECGVTPDQVVLEQIQLYADLNQVPETAGGLNVQAYYLGQKANGEFYDLLTPDTDQRWQVGTTGAIPCDVISGLQIEVYYPQETLLTKLLAIEHARVSVKATGTVQN